MRARELHVAVQPLTEEAFGTFGRAVGRLGGRPPDLSGDGWACWYPVGELRDIAPLSMGLVRTDPRPLLVEAMERHPNREEWVYTLDRPVIQAVAQSAPANPDRPDAQSVTAFLLEPGQGVVMARGIWHSPALPVGDQEATYGFVLGQPRHDAQAQEASWEPFAGGECVVLKTTRV